MYLSSGGTIVVIVSILLDPALLHLALLVEVVPVIADEAIACICIAESLVEVVSLLVVCAPSCKHNAVLVEEIVVSTDLLKTGYAIAAGIQIVSLLADVQPAFFVFGSVLVLIIVFFPNLVPANIGTNDLELIISGAGLVTGNIQIVGSLTEVIGTKRLCATVGDEVFDFYIKDGKIMVTITQTYLIAPYAAGFIEFEF